MTQGIGPLHLKVNGVTRTIPTSHFADFGSSGFSFCVPSELEAYQAAYIYQHSKRVNVTQAAPGFGWSVQVYKEVEE